MKPLVAIFAHPDDEAFGPSGTLATFAKEREVYLICVTDGDAGQNALEGVTDLGQARREELRTSAKILGIKDVEFLGYKDGSLNNNLYHEVADKIEKLLEKYQPDTLLTFNQLGISGHIDHIFVSLVTTFVYKKVEAVKKLLYYCELQEVLGEMKDYFIYMPPGIKTTDADLVIDISGVLETKLNAIDTHKSQKQDGKMIKKQLLKYPKKEYFKILEKDNP